MKHTLTKTWQLLGSLLSVRQPVFCNVAEGTHAGHITQYLETSVTARYTIAKPGTTSGKVDIATATDKPIGIITDEGITGDPVNLALLGSASSTLLARAGASISAGDDLVPNATGQAVPVPASAGTYYVVGQAVADAASGTLVEFDPCTPRAITVN